MLFSPTEPLTLRSLGQTSSTPELFGSDVLLHTRLGVVGIQRKELSDLVASVMDGRLQRELAMMKNLALGVLLIEGNAQWTTDGHLLLSSNWTRSQHLGLIWSVQSRGYWVCQSNSLTDTCLFVSSFQKWLEKDRHSQLDRRPNAKPGIWGKVDNRDWAIHLLQSFPGLGYDRAAAIYDHFKGVPLQWTVTEKELQQVPGIGPGVSQRLISSIQSQSESSSATAGSSTLTPTTNGKPSTPTEKRG